MDVRLSATHRVNEDLTADEIIQSARSEIEMFLLNSIEANSMRLKRFSTTYSSEQIANEENLENQARSLLNIQSQLENALEITRSGSPIIYGVEVSGDQSALSEFRLNRNIEESIGIALSDTESIDRRNLKPEAYRKEYRDTVLTETNSNELHSMMMEKIDDIPNFLFMKKNVLNRNVLDVLPR